MQGNAMWRLSEPKNTKNLVLLRYGDPMSALGRAVHEGEMNCSFKPLSL